MIKRYVLLFIAINITSLYAILGGIGINFVQDSFTLDEEIIASSPVGQIVRTEMPSPIGLGGFAYLTLIPFLDFEVGANFTGATYEYSYTDDINSTTESLELPLAKLTWHVSAQKPIFKFPMIRMYAGAGFNGSTYTKIVSADLVNNLGNDCFSDEECMKEELSGNSTGVHLETGVRFKPPFIPFSLNFNARYNIVKDIVPNEDGLLTISLGAAFAI
mgnify:CR=1 FL=1